MLSGVSAQQLQHSIASISVTAVLCFSCGRVSVTCSVVDGGFSSWGAAVMRKPQHALSSCSCDSAVLGFGAHVSICVAWVLWWVAVIALIT
jgi:hypothetical protein